MITASDLRMVQQKHQEQYDALRQRLSEVEAERDQARMAATELLTALGMAKDALAIFRADQERMREAIDKAKAIYQNTGEGDGDVSYEMFAALSTPRQPQDYQCERCGGTGQQGAGLWTGSAYASKAGTCDFCAGTGRLAAPRQEPT